MPAITLPHLPLEIISKILESTYELDLDTLCACSLVCTVWATLTRPLVFRSIRPRRNLSDILDHSASLFHTRSLDLYVIPGSSIPLEVSTAPGTGYETTMDVPEFVALLERCPNLNTLKVLAPVFTQVESNDVFPEQTLARLTSAALRIRTLHFTSPSLMVYDLLTVCPGVEALCIFDCMRPKTPRPPLALRELRMPSVVSSPALRWFLPPDETHSTLRILQLSQPHVDDDDVFRNCARHITSLTLRRSPYPGFFEHFTALEELTIAGVWWQSPYPSFPKTLRHLRLQVARLAYDVLPEIADTIRQLPHLHTLSVKENLVQGRSSYPTLLQACRDKHVNILVDPRGDDAPKHPYHIEMDRFPRQQTFSEFFGLD